MGLRYQTISVPSPACMGYQEPCEIFIIIFHYLYAKCFINLFSIEILQEYNLYLYFQNIAYDGRTIVHVC
jgi:hypothetical protein